MAAGGDSVVLEELHARPTETAAQFVKRLGSANDTFLARLSGTDTLEEEVAGKLSVTTLLRIALRNELEATEIAARWLATTPLQEVEVKLGLARQVGDESRHYRLIQQRLRELGDDTSTLNPVADGYGPLFRYLETLHTSVERVAAGQFTRERLAMVKNGQFIAYLRAVGDDVTADLYEGTINEDERYHHELGRTLLLALATDGPSQRVAEAAAHRTLELAEELQGKAREKLGLPLTPGC